MEVILSNRNRKQSTYIVKYSMQEKLAMSALRKKSGSSSRTDHTKVSELTKTLFSNRSNNRDL